MKEQFYCNFPNVGFVGLTLDPQELVSTIKEMNDKIIVFPGNMTHSVNPFYTSDDYRVLFVFLF
jgi:hypothetical protein